MGYLGYVFLDAGHNEYVSGKQAPDKSMREWEFNNDMQYRIKRRLEDHSIYVFLTNPSPAKKNEIGLSKRPNLANAKWNDLNKPSKSIFISIHANASGDSWSNANGPECYVGTRTSSTSKTFCKTLNDEVYAAMKKINPKCVNRGCKSASFTVIQKANMPAVLMEYAFYSNKTDLNILKNHRDELAEATVKAVCKHFGVTYKSKTSAPSKPVTESKPTAPAKPAEKPVETKPTENAKHLYMICYNNDVDKTAAETLTWGLGKDKCILVDEANFKPNEAFRTYAVGAVCSKVEADIEIQGKDRWETLDLIEKHIKNK